MAAESSPSPRFILFGDFLLDRPSRELRRGGELVHLSTKALQLLEYLSLNNDRAIPKQELYDSIWGNIVVEEVNLPNLVSELRGALGDDARKSRIVKTVHRYGYRFIAAVKGASQPPASARPWTEFMLVSERREHMLEPGENIAGRSPESQVYLPSDSVSRRHGRLTVENNVVEASDLGSKNGTFLNGHRLTSSQRLADGDTIRFGDVSLVLRRSQQETKTMEPRKRRR